MAYSIQVQNKFKYIVNNDLNFRESLEAILDEKTLREQMVIFNVDGQQTTAMGSEKHGRTVGKKASRAVPLLDEHRTNLMPILLRLNLIQ